MIIGLIVKYAGAGPTARGVRVYLENATSAPQTLWVTLSNSANFSYNLKGMLRTVTTKAGSELEDMVNCGKIITVFIELLLLEKVSLRRSA